jgi:hypothetical protein
MDQVSVVTLQSSGPVSLFSLGRIGAPETEVFRQSAITLWGNLFGAETFTREIPSEHAIEVAARHFKRAEQPLDNAKEVLRAIMWKQGRGEGMVFGDLCRFLAMFGPGCSVMMKIASLLTCSNSTGKWLTFDRTPGELPTGQGRFEEGEPNCLLVKHSDGQEERVYNDPTIAHGMREYLTDDRGFKYRDWDDYFQSHPVRIVDLEYGEMI